MHLYRQSRLRFGKITKSNLTIAPFWCRPARAEGAGTRGGHAEPVHHLPQRPRFWLRLRIFASQLLVQTSGEAARAQDSVHPGPPTHLLPEVRGHSASPSHRGQNIHGHAPVLRRGDGGEPPDRGLGPQVVLRQNCWMKETLFLRDRAAPLPALTDGTCSSD